MAEAEVQAEVKAEEASAAEVQAEVKVDEALAAAAGAADAAKRASRPPPVNKAEMARRRAQDKKDPNFFNGEDALREVAKPNGVWNWALVGPDPEALPLSAGGQGGVEDMQEAFGNYPVMFGLVRLSFTKDEETRTKWAFVQVSNRDDDDSGFSQRARGQANMTVGKMTDVVKRLAEFEMKIEIHSKADCNLRFLLEWLQNTRGGDICTEENYNHAKKQEREQLEKEHPEVVEQMQKQEERERAAEEMQPQQAVEEAVLDMAPEEIAASQEVTRQRKSIKKLYRLGDPVEVFSGRRDRWIIDGEVVDFVDEACTKDRIKLRAGSMKVVYENGTKFVWISPAQFDTHARPSLRPRPPERLNGVLQKETHNWIGAEWHDRYFELNHGFISWWLTAEEMNKKETPLKCFSLLGLQMNEPQGDSTRFRWKSDATRRTFNSFDGRTKETSAQWLEAMWEHSEYCEEIKELTDSKWKGEEARKELLASMQERRKSRKSLRAQQLMPELAAEAAVEQEQAKPFLQPLLKQAS